MHESGKVGISTFIQGLNSDLRHCRWILYQLSHQGRLTGDEAQRRRMSLLGARLRAQRFQPGSCRALLSHSALLLHPDAGAGSCPVCVVCVCFFNLRQTRPHRGAGDSTQGLSWISLCWEDSREPSANAPGLTVCWHAVRIRKEVLWHQEYFPYPLTGAVGTPTPLVLMLLECGSENRRNAALGTWCLKVSVQI